MSKKLSCASLRGAVLLFLLALVALTHGQCPHSASGLTRWSQWGSRPTAAGAAVTIPSGQRILLDVSPPNLASITVDGTLVFDNVAINLDVGWIHVKSTGLIEMGSESCRLTAKIIITLRGTYNGIESDPRQKGIYVEGGRLEIHGRAVTKSWTRLSATAQKGATTLQLQDDVSDWSLAGGANPEIVIATTDFDPNQSEGRTIASISGRTVTLSSGLANMHYGAEGEFAEVGLLTRNIVVRGLDDTYAQSNGFGGHIMVASNGVGRVEGVELSKMGQKGIEGRYPMHFHMLNDVSSKNVYFKDSSTHHGYQRCVTVHTTSGATIQGIVSFDTLGHCYFIEDGPEINNVFDRNLGVLARKMSPPFLPSDDRPSIFWITNPNNIFTNNAAAGASFGYWYALPVRPIGRSTYLGDSLSPRNTPLGTFKNNVAHSMDHTGWHSDDMPRANGVTEQGTWQALTGNVRPNSVWWDTGVTVVPMVVEDVTSYKCRVHGIWARTTNIKFVRAKLYDNHKGIQMIGGPHVCEECLFVGLTGNKGQPSSSRENTAGRTIPLSWAFSMVGFEGYDFMGPSHCVRCEFRGYTPLPAAANLGVGALGLFDHGSGNILPENKFIQCKFDNTNKVYISENSVFPRSPDCTNCDTMPSLIIPDIDGALTGKPGGWVASRYSLHHETPGHGCTFNAAWNMAECPPTPYRHYAVEVINENIGGTSYAGSDSYIRARVYPFGSDGSEARRLDLTGIGSGTSRDYYSFNVRGRHGYLVHFDHPTPPRLKIMVRQLSYGDWVVFAFRYPSAPASVTKMWNSATIPALTDNNYFFDSGNRLLYIMLRQSSATNPYPSDKYGTLNLWNMANPLVETFVTVTAASGSTGSTYIPPAWAHTPTDTYEADLQACQVVPATTTATRGGKAYLVYDRNRNFLHFLINHPFHDEMTSVRLLIGAAGASGTATHTFDTNWLYTPMEGGFTPTAAQLQALHEGRIYVQVNTKAKANGELRGQFGCKGTCSKPSGAGNVANYPITSCVDSNAPPPSPVNCVVSAFGAWSACSATCGGGTQTRSRTVTTPAANGGTACPALQESRACNTQACPVDCVMTAWSAFGICSQACGGGTQTRTRSVSTPAANGGRACGATSESAPCNEQACAVNCAVSEFGAWGSCSAACGGGTRQRSRTITTSPANGGTACPGLVEEQSCNTHSCAVPVDCALSAWSVWGTCDNCAGGSQTRSRTIVTAPANGGAACGVLTQSQSCSFECDIDCEVSEWSAYSICSADCGGGTQTRTRQVVRSASGQGRACGALSESTACNTQECSVGVPTDCILSEWSTTNAQCSVSCGGGVMRRSRTIVTPASNGGLPCGELTDEVSCNTQTCAVNCVVSAWSTFGVCSSCEPRGTRTRTRSIVTAPSGGGSACPTLAESIACTDSDCPTVATDCQVSEWGEFGACSVDCGGGQRLRTRSVIRPSSGGGQACPALSETAACNTQACPEPMPCLVSAWSNFGLCSRVCAGGVQTRTRTIVRAPTNGGEECPHLSEDAFCNVHPCPPTAVPSPTPQPTPTNNNNGNNNNGNNNNGGKNNIEGDGEFESKGFIFDLNHGTSIFVVAGLVVAGVVVIGAVITLIIVNAGGGGAGYGGF